MDSIADFMRKQAEDRQKASVGAASIVLGSVTDSPDQVAGDLNLANEFGKMTGNPVPPAPMVKEYRSLFQQQIEERRAVGILSQAPTLAEFVRNPENAALARDDLGALSFWDKIGKSFKMGEAKMITGSQGLARDLDASLTGSAFGRGIDDVQDSFDAALLTNEDGSPNFLGRLANWMRSNSAPIGQPVQMVGGDDVTAEQRAAALLSENLDPLYQGAKALLEKMEAEGFSPMSYKDVNGIGSLVSFIAENLAMSAPQMGAAMASGAFSPLIQMLGLGGEVNEELKERAPELSAGARVSASLGAGAVMTALETFGLSRIFGVAGRSATGEIAAEAVTGTLMRRILANGGTQALGRAVTAAITEGTTEALQEAIKIGVVSLAGGEYKYQEVVEGLLQAFFAGTAAGGAMRAGVEGLQSAGRFAKGKADAQQAESTANTIGQIGAAAGQSKLRQRMPDRFRELAAKALDGSPAENMFVPSEAAQAYFQSIGADLYALTEFDGVTREDIDYAIETGGDIKIPTATYAALIAGSEHDAWFQANAKFDPDAMTAEDAAAFNERVTEIQQEMWEEAEIQRLEDETYRATETKIYDEMVSRWRAANLSTEEATTNAMALTAFYKTQAERQNVPLEDYLIDHPLPIIEGARPTGMQMRDVDQVNIALAELRNRSTAKRETPLLDFIRKRGGIDDVGGELAARNADAGRKPFQRSLARKPGPDGKPRPLTAKEMAEGKRYGWDYTAQAAVEAGFLNDHPVVQEWLEAQRLGDRVAPDLIPVLMEAIDQELAGGSRSEQDAALDEMEEYLARIGADLSMDDAAIRDLINADQDAAGRMYAQDGSITIESEAFKAWFGDSKVVDADGKPLVVYHSTGSEFDAFDTKRESLDQWFGQGSYFATDIDDIEYHIGRPMDEDDVLVEAYLSIKNPYVWDFRNVKSPDGRARLLADIKSAGVVIDGDNLEFDGEKLHGEGSIKWREWLISNGYDGVIVEAYVDGALPSEIIALHSEQIKSVNNRGTWDANDPRILYQSAIDSDQPHPFAGVSREQFLGSPTITSDGNASTLVPNVLPAVAEVESVPFASGKGLTAKYHEYGAAVFDGDKPVASYNFGDTLVVDKKYRRKGIASELVYQWRMRNPNEKPAKYRTKKSQAVQEQVWDRIQREIAPPTLFQREGRIRGQLEIRENAPSIMTLFASRNLSTVQHELGHLFLTYMQRDAMAGIPAAVAEYEAIKSWWRDNAAAVAGDGMRAMLNVKLSADDVKMAIDTGTTGDAMKDAAIDVGMQEQFARGYEAYLMEGKAPSIELKTVFSKLSAWMVSIYKRLRGLNVQMSDDIRAVFDRMLATDEQIAAAKQSTGEGGPMFATADMMGLTQEEYERYLKMREQAEAEAKGRLLAEVMEPLRRQKEQWWKEERERVKAEVTAQMQAMPVYQAVQEMRFGKGFNGEASEVPKFDRKAIERYYGAGYMTYLPGAILDADGNFKGGHRFAVFGNEGAHPDIVAGIFGFPSGRDLLDAMTKAPPIAEAIEAETARVMDERHGDALNDGEIELIALDAVHSDKRTEWIAKELQAVKSVIDGGVDMSAKEARIVARETLEKMTVKDASASHRYLAAERKAAEEAYQLAGKLTRTEYWQNRLRFMKTNEGGAPVGTKAEQDMVARLYTAKRRQLLNHALYMESRKAREFVGKVEEKTAKLNRSDKQLSKRADVNYIKAARAVAAKFGLASGDKDFDVQAWLEQLKFEDPAGFTAIQDAIVTYTQDAQPYKQMNLSAFGALNDAIDSLLETGKRFKDIEIGGKKVEKAAAVDDLLDPLFDRGTVRTIDKNTDKLPKSEKRIRTIMGFASALRRVENWARAMDMGQQGPYTKYIVRPIMEALDNYRGAKEETLTELLAIIEPLRKDLYKGGEIVAPELGGFKFSSMASVFHALLHTGNESNMAKLLIGYGWSAGYVNKQQAVTKAGKPRFRRDGSPVMTKGELDTSRWDAFIDRMVTEGKITPEHIKAVNAIWDLNEKLKRPAQAAHKKVFGFYFKEIEGAGYDTKAGRLKGGYVPAIVDSDFVNDGMMRESEAAIDQQSAGFMLPTAGAGFTKSRVENYTQRLKLDLTLLPAHMDKVLRFTHLDPAVRQTHGIITDRRFAEALNEYDPTLIDNMLMPWLNRVAKQSIDAPVTTKSGRDFSNVIRILRQRVGFNTMFANLVNVTQQVTGLSVAATLVKPSYLKDGAARFAKDMGGVRAEVFAASPYMRDRVKNATRETQMRIQDIIREPSTYGEFQTWVERHGYFMQQAVQNWIDVPVWVAAYDQAIANGMTEADAVFEADAVIRQTMGGMNPEDVSMFESGNMFKRLFTMFYTYFNGQANHIAAQGSVIWRQHGWQGKGKLFYLYLFGIMVPAVGAELIAQAARGELGDEDDDGYYWDDVSALFFGSQFRYATAMAPVVNQLTQLVFNQFNDKRYDDRLSPSPAFSTLERAGRAPFSIGSAVFGDGKASNAVGDGITAFALATGVPLNWLAKPLGYAAGVAEGRSAPEGPIDVLQGIVSGRDGTED